MRADARSEPVQLPSSWPATGELSVLSSRVQAHKRVLASLRDSEPRVDRWLEAAAMIERDMPLRASEPAAERERCDGCARCTPRRTDAATPRAKGKRNG